MLFSYIRKHLPLHIIICSILAVLFLMQLLMIGELYVEREINENSVETTTYTFCVRDASKEKLDTLLSRLEGKCDDIGLEYFYTNPDYVGDVEDLTPADHFQLVTFALGLSERRYLDFDFNSLKDDQVYHTSMMNIMFTDDEVVEIEEYPCNGVNLKSIDRARCLTFTFFNDFSEEYSYFINPLYANYDTFTKVLGDENVVELSILEYERLSVSEASELKSTIEEIFGDYEYIAPSLLDSEIKYLLSEYIPYILLLLVLVMSCFSKLIWTIIKKREAEYQVFRYYGATQNYIENSRVLHLLTVLIASEIAGIILFVTLRAIFPDFVAFKADSLLFYGLNAFVYILVSLATVLIYSKIEKRKRR